MYRIFMDVTGTFLSKHLPMFEVLLSFYKKVDGKTKKKYVEASFQKTLF
jgi:hypothetical protein